MEREEEHDTIKPDIQAWNRTMVARASLVAKMVKNLPAMKKTLVWFLGWEEPLEKGMATYASILAWRIPWTEESGRQ